MRRFAIAWIGGACLLVVSQAAFGQQTSTSNQSSPDISFKCRHPADPRRRQSGCNDHEFTLDETLAGSWGKVRQAMQRIGITPTASYVGGLQTNVTGSRDQVWSYAGQLSFGFSADLGELIRAGGLSAYAEVSWGTGSNLAGPVGSVIDTSGLYAPSFYLGEMYLQQKLMKNKVAILAGRLAAGNTFAQLPVFGNYVNYGINPSPISLGVNDYTFPGPPPGSEWGAQATYSVRPSLQLAGGVFNTNLNSAFGANHGADFTIQEGNKGVLAIGEVSYLRNQATDSEGKPGQITAGVLHNSNAFPNLVNPLERNDGLTGAYLLGQQMVFRPEGPGTNRGATVWAAGTLNYKKAVSPIPLFWGAGASYEGLIPLRKHDIVSFCLMRTQASGYALPENTEQFLELNYQWNHSRFLTITPLAQYLWIQEKHGTRNATILGIQVGLTL